MAFTEYTGDTTIIGALGTNPAERGLTTQEFKDKFDQFADEFVAWFNATHVVEANAHLADTTPHSGATPEFNGVKFPATQVASADANTLDDYEEGTWTPEINRALGGSPSEVTYTSNAGKYTKIGRIVFISAYIAISGVITDGAGLNCVEGLPFTPATTYKDVGSVFYNDIFSTSTAMSVTAHGSDNRLYFKDATRGNALMNENWVAGSLGFSLAYLV